MRPTLSLPAAAMMATITLVAVPMEPRGVDALDMRGCHEIVGGDCDAAWTAAPQPK